MEGFQKEVMAELSGSGEQNHLGEKGEKVQSEATSSQCKDTEGSEIDHSANKCLPSLRLVCKLPKDKVSIFCGGHSLPYML